MMKLNLQKKLLHQVGRAIAEYNMIQRGDRILICLSGGKDSFVLVKILQLLMFRSNYKFNIFVLMINPGLEHWDDKTIQSWLTEQHIPFEVLNRDIFSIVKQKIPEQQNYCSFCSRLRRGIIYTYAREKGFTKIALGHHRDDLISSVLMSMLYSGEIRTMPPKLLTNTKEQIVIRPLVYCQEKDILAYAEAEVLPYMKGEVCSVRANTTRPHVKALIESLAHENPKVPSNLLHALQNVKITQLMDHRIWNFKELEKELLHKER
jgi:tRNA 2-thiocytidine biosynthesis protein TtcA